MYEYNQNNERIVLQNISEGDEKAFRELFDSYKKQLFSFAFDFTHSAADAEEIVQNTFLKIWEGRSMLKEVLAPRPYIYKMVRNNTYNYLQKAARDEQLMRQIWANMSVQDDLTEDLLQVKECREMIHKAVSQLSEKKQTIFRLSRDEGMKHEEIARVMGLSKSTVKNILVETLKHIKDYLLLHAPHLLIFFWCFFNG